MSITVWAAPASRLQSRYILRFLRDSRLPIRASRSGSSCHDRQPSFLTEKLRR
jgi:hypothetical protein